MAEAELIATSLAETEAIGAALADLLHPGDLVLLRGELGAGKTALVRGVARGLGLPDPREVASPTFALVHVYEGGRAPILHSDLYRIEDEEGARRQGVLDGLFDPDLIKLVEWPDRCPSILAAAAWEVTIEHAASEHRRLRIRGESVADGHFSKWRPRGGDSS